VLVLALLLTACAAEPVAPAHSQPALPRTAGPALTIFVTSNGWHSSIVFARADLPPGRVPEAADFPDARFLEFGWGDAEYYPAKDATVGMALSAALVPTPAVVHVAGLPVEPARRYPKAEVVPISVDAQGLGRLVKFIDATFARGGGPRATATGLGLYATSLFYPALGRFHLFNTCNTWTARALAAAGFDVSASGTSRAEALSRQTAQLSGTTLAFPQSDLPPEN
jgi:uncharacterized protein (TIGR02117 family)